MGKTRHFMHLHDEINASKVIISIAGDIQKLFRCGPEQMNEVLNLRKSLAISAISSGYCSW